MVASFRFLHAADIHLDSPLHGLSRYDGLPVEEIRSATRTAFDNLVRCAIDDAVDFVMIAGDLFDGDWRDMGTGLYFARAMGRLNQAGIPTFILAGNHDAASVISRTIPWPPNVRMFESRRPKTHRLPDLSVAVHGQSFSTPAVTDNLVLAYPAADEHFFNIGVLHTALAGRQGHADYAPCSLDDLRGKGYQYWALGHVHEFEIVSTDPYVVFPGNVQGRTIRETGAKGAVIVTVVDHEVTTVDRIELDAIRWVRLEVDCGGTLSDDVVDLIRAELGRLHGANASGRPLVARVTLVGETSDAGVLHDRAASLRDDVRAIAAGISPDLYVEKVKVTVSEPARSEIAVGEDLGTLIDEAAADPELAKSLEADLGRFMLAASTALGEPEESELRREGRLGSRPADGLRRAPLTSDPGGLNMRFSRLSLERYGRFEGCELNFRSGRPDLHIIYGANEAGKTTSLSAVSDLLFGFQIRSPYNFLFHYALLRVGAVLEDDGWTLACRRKKGTGGTLLDGNDATIDEVPLLGMLKGQTRETFGLSFSLNQMALRSGGKAMVEARNDLGRTLFAAGSGLTGIADALKGLESEADNIWGSTAKASRTFAQAHRQYAEATKAVRDGALKPKAWSDAKSIAERTRTALEAARRDRDAVQAELRATERVRRLGPLARRRDEQIEALRTYEGTSDLGRQREDAAEKLIQEADEAVRERSAAEQLRADLAERRSKVAADPTVLAEEDEINQLVADAGAVTKAARDLVGLEAEHAAAVARVERLQKEAAGNADAAPQRVAAARLREFAGVYRELQAAGRQIAESRDDIDERRTLAKAKLAEEPGEDLSDALIDAVDAARALGADADALCGAARRKADAAAASATSAIVRLAPWTGDISDLVKLPVIGAREIDDAREALTEASAEMRREEEQARRSSDQADGVALRIAQIATGTAVSPEEIAGARAAREQRWQPLRLHVLTGAPVDAPYAAVAEFEASVAAADEKMDLRFALADASSRLSILEQAKATYELEKSQADKRAEQARGRQTEILNGWITRLADVGLPALEPTRFQTWQVDRVLAEEADRELRELRAEADRADSRRNAARSALSAALAVADTGGALAPVLATAERQRARIEEASQQHRLVQSELDQIEADAVTLDRRQQRLDSDVAANAKDWTKAISEAGLELDVSTCGAVLDLLDELREAVASEAVLRRQIEGIARDAREHASRIEQVADRIGVETGETAARLRTLRERLAAARSAAALLTALDEEDRRREGESNEAQAKLTAAEEALSPLLIETKSADRAELTTAIERSRLMRSIKEEIAPTERRIVDEGDGLSLDELVAAVAASDPKQIAERVSSLDIRLEELNHQADEAATVHGDARSSFAALDTETTSAVNAASDAEQARAELEVLADFYILKRAQALTLKWAIEKYRERHQDPLLLRAGELFSTLTIGRYATLRVDTDGPSPRLLGLRNDGRTMVEVEAMSEGTTDQLFLALRLAALEQSVAAGISLPFLADDLFVNFDDQRAEAGFKVLANVAKSTQVLFFTHHPHLVAIAKSVVGPELHSECALQ